MTFLYFSPVPWASYPQRPHYFARHFLKRGGSRVVWVDPYPIRLPTFRDLRRIAVGPQARFECPDGLTVVSLRAVPIEPLGIGRWLNRTVLWNILARRLRPLVGGDAVVLGVGRPSCLALAALTALRPAHSFYDAMDDYPEFYHGISKASAQAHEREIVRSVDVVLTSCGALWTKFASRDDRRVMVHNAFEMSALPPLPIARNADIVFGYVGCIGAWFDWSIVLRLAESFRDAALHIVGPCFSPPPHDLPLNVRLFPACLMERAVEHLRSFSVGLIPFSRSPLTDAVDPVKYYGYRGMGLPVLSTAFGEMARRGIADGTFLMDQGADPVEAASSALDYRADVAAIARFRLEHAWDRRFEDAGVFDRALA